MLGNREKAVLGPLYSVLVSAGQSSLLRAWFLLLLYV